MEMCAKNKYEISPNTNTNKLQTQMYAKYKCAPNTLPGKEWCALRFHHYPLCPLSSPLDKMGGKSQG